MFEARCKGPLGALAHLEQLNLSNNALRQLPRFHSPRLVDCKLDCIELEAIGDLFEALGAAAMSRMRSLSVVGNPLAEVPIGLGVSCTAPHSADESAMRRYRAFMAQALPALITLDGIQL